MTELFISYARTDQPLALRLAEALRKQGVGVRADWQIPAGSDWNREIDAALQRCTGVLLLLSPDAVQSAEAQGEYHFALNQGKHVVPVILRQCQLPRRLLTVQHIDLSGGRLEDCPALDEIRSAFLRPSAAEDQDPSHELHEKAGNVLPKLSAGAPGFKLFYQLRHATGADEVARHLGQASHVEMSANQTRIYYLEQGVTVWISSWGFHLRFLTKGYRQYKNVQGCHMLLPETEAFDKEVIPGIRPGMPCEEIERQLGKQRPGGYQLSEHQCRLAVDCSEGPSPTAICIALQGD